MDKLKQPTTDECSNNTQVYEDDSNLGFACWYPQMGGYGGYTPKCIAVFNKRWELFDNGSAIGGCIELYIWHGGEFPFTDEDGEPKHIHICSPEQFIILGKFLTRTNNKYCKRRA